MFEFIIFFQTKSLDPKSGGEIRNLQIFRSHHSRRRETRYRKFHWVRMIHLLPERKIQKKKKKEIFQAQILKSSKIADSVAIQVSRNVFSRVSWKERDTMLSPNLRIDGTMKGGRATRALNKYRSYLRQKGKYYFHIRASWPSLASGGGQCPAIVLLA